MTMSHTVPTVRPRRASEIEKIAYNIVAAYQPDAVKMITKFDVEVFFDCELEKQTGVAAVYKSLGNGLDGYTDTEKMECVICEGLTEYGEDEVKRRRLRATQAHETGHCYLHVGELRQRNIDYQFRHDGHASLLRYSQEEIKAYVNPEWQAWRFAGALLMPECCVRAAVDKRWTKKMMRLAFDVNPSFLDVRLRDLKIPNRIRVG